MAGREAQLASKFTFPPVFLSTEEIKLVVSREAKRGHIRKIGPRLYTTDVSEDSEIVIRRNLWEVIGLLFPDTVVGYRTALEGKPSPEGTVNLVGNYDRMVELPGLTIRQIKGPRHLEGDTPFMGRLWLASRARAFLESLRPSRATAAGARGLPQEEIELRIEQIVRISGETEVNSLRDQARAIAADMDAEDEFRVLSTIIGTVLGSQSASLTSPAAVARAAGEPYDPDRLERFQSLHSALLSWISTPRPSPVGPARAFQNAAFVDAYFSNYIEGTEFGVEEAIEIVFEGRIPERRPADAHDVLGTYRIVSSRDEMGISQADPRRDFDDFIQALRRRVHDVPRLRGAPIYRWQRQDGAHHDERGTDRGRGAPNHHPYCISRRLSPRPPCPHEAGAHRPCPAHAGAGSGLRVADRFPRSRARSRDTSGGECFLGSQ